MMRTSMTHLAFDGSAAVAHERPGRSLTLLEGGRGRHDAKPTPARGSLTARQLVGVIAVACCFVCALVATSLASDALRAGTVADALAAAPVETVLVRPGDTLWGLAEDRRPAGVSAAELVDWAIQRNDLSSGALVAGQRLVLPLAQ